MTEACSRDLTCGITFVTDINVTHSWLL